MKFNINEEVGPNLTGGCGIAKVLVDEFEQVFALALEEKGVLAQAIQGPGYPCHVHLVSVWSATAAC